MSIMKKFYNQCEKEVETQITNKKEKYTIYGNNISIDTQILICTKCGRDLND